MSVIPQGDLVITNVALGAELADSNGRTSVKLTYTRPCILNLTFEEDDEFLLEVVGKKYAPLAYLSTVHCSSSIVQRGLPHWKLHW